MAKQTFSQGVAALVSVSDGKIQISILILRRGPCLLSLSKVSQSVSDGHPDPKNHKKELKI